MYDKRYYLNNQIKDNVWLEITQQLGYDEDEVLQEIQKSLEGDQTSFLENNVNSAVA